METSEELKPSTAELAVVEGPAENHQQKNLREEALERMLSKCERQFFDGDFTGTVGEYLRLLEAGNETADQRPREIEIRWVTSDER